ncbi:MAG: anti-sigma factor [Thiomonas sp.]
MSAFRLDRQTLMAYVDGQLDAKRHAQVEQAIDADSRLAAEVQALQQQTAALRAALDPLLDEPIPPRLLHHAAPPRRQWVQAVVVALLVGVSAVVGGVVTSQWRASGGPALAQGEEGAQHFVQQAVLAYAVYTPDPRRPVEVRNGSDLTTWLSRRLDRPIIAPDSLPGGLELMGGRLLPGMPGKPAAQIMYQDAQGRRLTVYLRGMAKPTAQTAFRLVTSGRATTLYWVDRNWGYAVTGDLPRDALLQAAKALYARYSAAAQPSAVPAAATPRA